MISVAKTPKVALALNIFQGTPAQVSSDHTMKFLTAGNSSRAEDQEANQEGTTPMFSKDNEKKIDAHEIWGT
jgi:hypothetical protein